jgi:hypothetical protein
MHLVARLGLALSALTLLAAAPAPAPAKGKPPAKAKGKPTKTKEPPKAAAPEWLSWKPGCRIDGDHRDFVAVGRSEASGTPEAQATQAEDDARQHLGEAIASWQERVLKCAKKASESKVTASSTPGKGLISFDIQTATEISIYQERVDARAPDGKRSAVLMKHDLNAMIVGIGSDSQRSAALREAVKTCGQQSFDELAAH